MTVHPLNLRKQVLYKFKDVRRVRFESQGNVLKYRIELKDGSPSQSRRDILNYLDENRGMGSHVELDNWQDGPTWPVIFDSLSDDLLQLVEACDTTKNGVQASLLLAFEDILAVRCETTSRGTISFVVQSKSGQPSEEELQAYRNFVLACIGVPGVQVDVVAGTVAPEPKSTFDIPMILNQASREGIQEPCLLELVESDEDFYRDFRIRGFPSVTDDLLPAEMRGTLKIYISPNQTGPDIRAFVPLYDSIFVPVEALADKADKAYGMKGSEVQELIAARRLIPVATRRLGDYDQGLLRSITDAGHLITPRRLAAGMAGQFLAANPLWRISMNDSLLTKYLFDEIRNGISVEPNVPSSFRAFLGRWLDFQAEGCLDFTSGYLNEIGFLPLRFGPGAFLAKVFEGLLGDKAPDVEAMLIGAQVSQSMSLGAVCVPIPVPPLYRIYELLALTTGARESRHPGEALQHLPVVAKLDKILSSLQITVPEGMSVSEWISIVSPLVEDLRAALNSSFSVAGLETPDEVQKQADKLEKDLAKLTGKKKRASVFVDKFEIDGLASEALTLLLDAGFPLVGTLTGVIIKRVFPKLWNNLSNNRNARKAQDILEAVYSFVPPNVVRLHRVRQSLRERL